MPDSEALAQYRDYVAKNPQDKESARRSFYDTFQVDPEASVSGESQTAPQAAQRGAPTSAEARRKVQEFGLSSLPALGAMGAAALTVSSGPAAPLTAAALSAFFGGLAGKGVEMGLRTGTGIGAENVPPTLMGRMAEGTKAGVEQMGMEVGAGLALRGAEKVALMTLKHSTTSELAKKMLQQSAADKTFAAALTKNDAKISEIEKAMADAADTAERSVGSVRKAALDKAEALAAQKRFIQSQADEQALRISHLEAAQESVDKALSATGAGVPQAGMTKAAYEQKVGSLAKQYEKGLIETIGGNYVGLEQEAAKRAPAPIDVRPLFQQTVAKIRAIPKLPGTGSQFTEVNKILSQLETDFNQFATGKKAAVKEVAETSPVLDASGNPITTTRKILSEATAAVDENASLSGLLVMQGNLSQAAAKVAQEGKSGERTARILRGLMDDTDKFIKAKMLEQGWKEGPGALDAVRKSWAEGSAFMEQQAFQTLKKAPERAHELLDASSGYAPVLKKVLKDTNGYETMWPEIRRRWIEDQFVKNGALDARGFLDGLHANRSILGEIFDTPAAKLQLQRLETAAGRIDALTNGVTKNAAEYAKMEAFKNQLLKIGDDLAAVDARVEKNVEEIMSAGKMRQEVYREKLSTARGVERQALKDAYEAKVKQIGLQTEGLGGRLFGPVPQMLMSRGAAGAVMGGAAGLLGGHAPSIGGALGGLAVGYGLQRAEVALTKRLVHVAEDPAAYREIVKALDAWRTGWSPRAAQALRTSLLGYEGGKVALDLMPSHEVGQ